MRTAIACSGRRIFGTAVLCCAIAGCRTQTHIAANQPPAPEIADVPALQPLPSAQIQKNVPSGVPPLTEVGLASWYGPPYTGRKGADGTVYDENALTAAHLTLPLGSIVRVTNLANGQSVVVKITDRGPFVHGRIIDLSLAAAKATGVYRVGVAQVRLEEYTPVPSPNAIPGGRWCVQIGAFYNPDDAIQLKSDLTRRYSTAKVIEFQGPTGYWVRINPRFSDKQTASQIIDAIHIPDAEAYLTRTD